MTAEKFGLAELERYEAKVGFKKSDVRTIRGVCAIVDLPLTVVPEAEKIIAACNKDIVHSEERVAKIKAEDTKDDEGTKANFVRLKDERKYRKDRNEQSITASKVEASGTAGEIARLQKLLKNFS